MDNKVALISGGSKGIGKAIVFELIKRGTKVFFTYLNGEEESIEIEKKAVLEGGEAVALKVDVKDYEETKKIVEKIIDKTGKIDILVNNAGITRDKTLLMMSLDEWKDVLDTNLTGTFNLTRNCVFQMLKAKSGRIINLSSISGIEGLAGQSNYSASKAGIIGFTRALAKEVARYGITANTVAPGGVNTAMLDKISPKAKEMLLKGVPCERFCEPDEVANVVSYLAYDSPIYLTGNVIVLDGGAGIG
jgi:3-oxoacyl-[acyl-carrier protein] reductase